MVLHELNLEYFPLCLFRTIFSLPQLSGKTIFKVYVWCSCVRVCWAGLCGGLWLKRCVCVGVFFSASWAWFVELLIYRLSLITRFHPLVLWVAVAFTSGGAIFSGWCRCPLSCSLLILLQVWLGFSLRCFRSGFTSGAVWCRWWPTILIGSP